MLQNNSYKIRINEPCHENWQGMADTDVGKFCNSCKKDVVDFTNFSNNEIINYLKQNGITSGCGKFLNTQIEQIRIVIDEDILVYKLSYWKKFIVALLICFGGKCLNAEISFGQIVKQDSSILKNNCDSFNTGESYNLAEQSIVGKKIDSMAVDTAMAIDTAMAADTTIKIKDTLKFVWDSTKNSDELLEIKLNITTTLGFFVPYLEKNIFELIPKEVAIFEEGIINIPENKKPTSRETISAEKYSPSNSKVPPTKQKESMPINAILLEEKSKKRKRKK
jgi:hypothetical protein